MRGYRRTLLGGFRGFLHVHTTTFDAAGTVGAAVSVSPTARRGSRKTTASRLTQPPVRLWNRIEMKLRNTNLVTMFCHASGSIILLTGTMIRKGGVRM